MSIHISEYLNPLKDAILAGQHAYNQASAITTSLERHKVLEDEVKTLRATIKAIKNKRRSLLA